MARAEALPRRSRTRPSSRSGARSDRPRFQLYVEGPGDRGILRAWSFRLLPAAGPRLLRDAVILGGRQPARAIEHFEREGPGARGLCILDRDDAQLEEPGPVRLAEGLELFTWSRRHIESYLLVPSALRRAIPELESDGRLGRLLRDVLPPPGDEHAFRSLDAKRLLGSKGPVARALGRRVPLTRLAQAIQARELHEDVHQVFELLRSALGEDEPPRFRR